MKAFGTWLGRTPAVVTEYLPADSWAQFDDARPWINPWIGSPWTMSFAIQMFPPGGSLEEGATGAYDVHFKRLATQLVERGFDRAILRLGWEFNGYWFRWRARANPTAFVEYWRRVVTAMRSVPGAHFTFDWNPLGGQQEFRAADGWPGDEYVDYVGVNVYDNWTTYPIPDGATEQQAQARREEVWQEKLNGVDGLNYWAEFAADHGKQLSIPEWALTQPIKKGGGDNPYFVEQMHDWIQDHDVAYFSYFNTSGGLGNHRLNDPTIFPVAAARFRELFGAQP